MKCEENNSKSNQNHQERETDENEEYTDYRSTQMVPSMNPIRKCKNDAIPNAKTSEVLVLKNRMITNLKYEVPEETINERLIEIEISNSLLQEIPENLSNCVKLQNLDLSHNFISSISPVLLRLKNLTRLSLSHNRLKWIGPADVYRFSRLKTLLLSSNVIDSVTHEIYKLSNMRALSLDGNPLMAIPCSIRKMKNLKSLRVDWPLYSKPAFREEIVQPEIARKYQERKLESPQSGSDRYLYLSDLFMLMDRLSTQETSSLSINSFLLEFSSNGVIPPSEPLINYAIKHRHQGIAIHFLKLENVYGIDAEDMNMCNQYGREIGETKHSKTSLLHRFQHSTVLNFLKMCIQNRCNRLVWPILKSKYPFCFDSMKEKPSLIHLAVDQMDLDLTLELIRQGAPVNCLDIDGNTPMHYLFMRINDKIKINLHQMLNNTLSLGDEEDIKQMKWDKIGALEMIIEKCKEFDRLSMFNSTFYKKTIDMAVLLLRNGANPNLFNDQGFCPWHFVFFKEDFETFKWLHTTDIPELSKIDWNVSLFSGEVPALHLVAILDNWRFLIEFIDSSRKAVCLEIDSVLKMAGYYIKKKNGRIPNKYFIKHFRRDFRNHLRGQTTEQTILKNAVKKRLNLLNHKTSSNTSITGILTKKIQSTSAKKKVPTFASSSLERFSREDSEMKFTEENDRQTKIILTAPLSAKKICIEYSEQKRMNEKAEWKGEKIATLEPHQDSVKKSDNTYYAMSTDPQTASGNAWLQTSLQNMLGDKNKKIMNSKSKLSFKIPLSSQKRPSMNCQDEFDEGVKTNPATSRSVSSYSFKKPAGKLSFLIKDCNNNMLEKMVKLISKRYFKQILTLKYSIRQVISTSWIHNPTEFYILLYNIHSNMKKLEIYIYQSSLIMDVKVKKDFRHMMNVELRSLNIRDILILCESIISFKGNGARKSHGVISELFKGDLKEQSQDHSKSDQIMNPKLQESLINSYYIESITRMSHLFVEGIDYSVESKDEKSSINSQNVSSRTGRNNSVLISPTSAYNNRLFTDFKSPFHKKEGTEINCEINNIIIHNELTKKNLDSHLGQSSVKDKRSKNSIMMKFKISMNSSQLKNSQNT